MPSNRFNAVIGEILKHEGGYNDIKGDSGGSTNFGVSLTFAKTINLDVDGDGDTDYLDIKLLTEKQAINIYWNNFWKPMYDKMPAGVGEKVFDVAVNAGASRAHKLLQQSLKNLGEKISIDGAIGNETLTALKKYTGDQVITAYCAAQAAFYNGLVAANPVYKKFQAGWLNRAKWKPSTQI